MAPDGDVYLADAAHNRVWRIDRQAGTFVAVAGTGVAGFGGDGTAATQAALHQPRAIAVGRSGDLYIADTMNHRVRVVSRRTGRIRTLAGVGAPATDGRGIAKALGDGGPAALAHLSHPTALSLAPDGDVYIADTGHNRVRVIDVETGTIGTVAGDGRAVARGDGGPAHLASLAGPSGLAVAASGRRGHTLYIAERLSSQIRVIDADGVISTLATLDRPFSPARLLYEPGWLYVVAENGTVTPVNLTRNRAVRIGTVAARLPGPRGPGAFQANQ
jgi:DNA-binding beta-propeller fold protein YncE